MTSQFIFAAKILQVNASYKPAYIYGGPTISVSKLSEMLVEAGENVEVLTTTANGKEDFNYTDAQTVKVDGVLVRYFKRITKDNSHFSPSLLIFLNKNAGAYPIVHIHAWWNLVSMGAALVCWKNGKKFILSPRGTLGAYSFINRSSYIKKFFHYLVGKRVLKNAIFQVSSKKEADDIKKLFPKSPSYIIPNFVDITGAASAISTRGQSSSFRLLFFSRIEKKKGLEFLLEALRHVTFRYVLNIYGDGDPNYIDQLKEIIPFNKNIHWKGAVYGNAKFQILAENDLLILPSFDENFANVVIEALAVGTPSLISNMVGVSDYVEEKELGWVCSQDAEVIAGCLNEISLLKEELSRIRTIAPGIIQTDFHEKTLTRRYLQFYSFINTSTN